MSWCPAVLIPSATLVCWPYMGRGIIYSNGKPLWLSWTGCETGPSWGVPEIISFLKHRTPHEKALPCCRCRVGCGTGSILASRICWNMRSKITSEGLCSTRGDQDTPSVMPAGICGCSETQESDLLPLAHPITSGQTVNEELDIGNSVKYLLILGNKGCPEKEQWIQKWWNKQEKQYITMNSIRSSQWNRRKQTTWTR